jgi:hypothetical protein
MPSTPLSSLSTAWLPPLLLSPVGAERTSVIHIFLIMIDWNDPTVVTKCAFLYINLSDVTAGAYTMEVLWTSVYDYEIVTRKC